MTKETMELFNIPWKLKEDYSVVYRTGKKHENEDWAKVFDITDKNEYEHYARFYDEEKLVKRFMHLPELYDALMGVAYDHCYGCMVEATRREPPHLETFIEHGCQRKAKQCDYNYWELLRKVRDAK